MLPCATQLVSSLKFLHSFYTWRIVLSTPQYLKEDSSCHWPSKARTMRFCLSLTYTFETMYVVVNIYVVWRLNGCSKGFATHCKIMILSKFQAYFHKYSEYHHCSSMIISLNWNNCSLYSRFYTWWRAYEDQQQNGIYIWLLFRNTELPIHVNKRISYNHNITPSSPTVHCWYHFISAYISINKRNTHIAADNRMQYVKAIYSINNSLCFTVRFDESFPCASYSKIDKQNLTYDNYTIKTGVCLCYTAHRSIAEVVMKHIFF